VQLLSTGRKYQLKNLYWLAAWSLTVAGYIIFAPTTPPTALSIPVLYYFGALLGQFFLIMFMHTTFYQGRKSPVGVFLGILALASFGVAYLVGAGDQLNAGLAAQAAPLVNWAWHLWLAWKAHQAISGDQAVEKWVKNRYRLMIAFSMVILAGNFLILPWSTPLAGFLPAMLAQLVAVLNLLGTILVFLVWVMPEPFRLWLNRDQFALERTDEDSDASAVFVVIGQAMAVDTPVNVTTCMYALRQTIGKVIQNQDADVINDHIPRMSYQDWVAVLNHYELRRSLSHFTRDAEVDVVIANGLKALAEKQSLLTLSAK
jgi:hypothetical protein